jgi:O-antigen ligase
MGTGHANPGAEDVTRTKGTIGFVVDTGTSAQRRIPGALLALLGLVILAIGFAVGTGPQLSSTQLLLVVGAVVGVVFALIAVNRFWWLILVLFAVRASLDALKSADGGGGLEAGTIVGVVFLATAAVWLYAQWRSGELEPFSPVSKAMLALAGAMLLSTPGAALPFDSVQSAMKFVAVAVMFVVLEQVFTKHPGRIGGLLVAVFVSLAVPALVALTQLQGGAQPTVGPGAVDVSRIQGTFVHPNMFAAYLVVLGLLAVALVPYLPAWRPALALVIVVVVPLLLLTYARGAWIGFYVGLLFIGLAQSRALLLALFTATIVIAIMVPSVTSRLSDLNITKAKQHQQVDANSAEWRVDYWRRVLPLFQDSPITGIGVDMIPHETPEAAPAHSAFVDTIVETGILGIVALLALIVTIWVGLRRAGGRLRNGPGRGVAVAAAAICLATLLQFFSESLVTQPAILWYAVAPLAWVIAVAGRRDPDAGLDDDPVEAFSSLT